MSIRCMTLLIGHPRKRTLDWATPFGGMLMGGGLSRVWLVALGPWCSWDWGGSIGPALAIRAACALG